jgi:hypothetical protein
MIDTVYSIVPQRSKTAWNSLESDRKMHEGHFRAYVGHHDTYKLFLKDCLEDTLFFGGITP